MYNFILSYLFFNVCTKITFQKKEVNPVEILEAPNMVDGISAMLLSFVRFNSITTYYSAGNNFF